MVKETIPEATAEATLAFKSATPAEPVPEDAPLVAQAPSYIRTDTVTISVPGITEAVLISVAIAAPCVVAVAVDTTKCQLMAGLLQKAVHLVNGTVPSPTGSLHGSLVGALVPHLEGASLRQWPPHISSHPLRQLLGYMGTLENPGNAT